MADLLTYIIYVSLLFCVILLTKENIKKRKEKSNFDLIYLNSKLKTKHFLAILIISLVAGFRYNVGTDWAGYKEYFLILKNNSVSFFDQTNEFGYFFINKLIGSFDLSYVWMFFIVAFISWYYMFKSIYIRLIPLFLYFLFVDEYFFWSLNGVRQFVAISIYLVSLKYIITKDIKRYLFYIFLGSLFHSSILLLIPMYFLPYRKMINREIWIVLFLVSVFFINSSLLNVDKILLYIGEKISFLSRYLSYEGSELLTSREVEFGAGVYFRLLINFVIIWFSPKVIRRFPHVGLYFILFFIGAIVFNLFMGSLLVGRYNHYFIILRSFVLAYTIYYFWSYDRYKLPIIMLMLMYFVLFISAINNSSNLCAPFKFV